MTESLRAGRPPKEAFSLTRDATRADFLAAIAAWERGVGVTGPYTMSLHRYWKMCGPLVGSQSLADDFEYVRRVMETTE